MRRTGPGHLRTDDHERAREDDARLPEPGEVEVVHVERAPGGGRVAREAREERHEADQDEHSRS